MVVRVIYTAQNTDYVTNGKSTWKETDNGLENIRNVNCLRIQPHGKSI